MSEVQAIEHLMRAYPDSSKSTLMKWIKFGRVKIADQTVTRKDTLFPEDAKVVLQKKQERSLPFEVLFEDAHIIVVHKPDYLLSVASLDPKERSVHGELKKHYNKVIYPLHRLDRQVTGPLIFAKTKEAYSLLKEAFYERDVHREYRALVHGKLDESSGVWESHLEEKKGYKMRASKDRGKHAITHFEVLDQTEEWTCLKLTLETGRKNQLRVHTAESGHPIFGDEKYGLPDGIKKIALYACSLDFKHPITKAALHFKVEAPFTFKKLEKVLGRIS